MAKAKKGMGGAVAVGAAAPSQPPRPACLGGGSSRAGAPRRSAAAAAGAPGSGAPPPGWRSPSATRATMAPMLCATSSTLRRGAPASAGSDRCRTQAAAKRACRSCRRARQVWARRQLVACRCGITDASRAPPTPPTHPHPHPPHTLAHTTTTHPYHTHTHQHQHHHTCAGVFIRALMNAQAPPSPHPTLCRGPCPHCPCLPPLPLPLPSPGRPSRGRRAPARTRPRASRATPGAQGRRAAAAPPPGRPPTPVSASAGAYQRGRAGTAPLLSPAVAPGPAALRGGRRWGRGGSAAASDSGETGAGRAAHNMHSPVVCLGSWST